MNARILFVDDEKFILDGLCRSLADREDRWEMHFLDSPLVALTAMAGTPFDVVVADVRMPGMDGITMIKEMRRQGYNARYILLTGTADLSVAVEAVNHAGIFRFLVKPNPVPLLTEAIEAALADRMMETVGEAALAHMSVGVIVVDSHAKVLFTNRFGARLMQGRNGLHLGHDGICRAESSARSRLLHDLIAASLTTGEGGVISLERRDEGRPLAVAICAIGPYAILYVSDPDSTPLPSLSELAKLLGLTPAEARLSHSLASGLPLEDAATTCGIAISTARVYLKQVFFKTGTRRQADLVRLILAQPTAIRPPAP